MVYEGECDGGVGHLRPVGDLADIEVVADQQRRLHRRRRDDVHLEDEDVLAEVTGRSDILINATRAGMSPLENTMPVPESILRPELAVADVVYNPRETLLIRKAREAGCRAAVGGIGMLLWQGAAAFELFTGQEMPAQEVMENFFS